MTYNDSICIVQVILEITTEGGKDWNNVSVSASSQIT